MTKPRLIVVGPLPPPVHGVTVSTSLVLANPRLREHFAVAHLDTSDHRDGANIGRWDLTNVYLGVRNLIWLVRLLRGGRGVIYLPISQSTGAFLRDSVFIRLARLAGWRIAIHLRGSEFGDFYKSQRAPYRWWARTALSRVSAAAVMGETLRDAFSGLVPDERIVVVSNGTPPNNAAERNRDTQCVLVLTNLRRRKGVIEAVEAAQFTLRKVPSARFLFVGSWEDEALERELKRSTDDTPRIEFLPPVSGPAKELLLASAGILLFTPREPEGHPRVILEAMAAGLPVVTTDRGAIRETVNHGVTGYVLKDPDPAEITSRLVELLENPDLHRRMSSAALSHYEAKYTQTAADTRLADWLGNVAAR